MNRVSFWESWKVKEAIWMRITGFRDEGTKEKPE